MPTLQPGSTSQAFDVDIGQTVSVTPGSGGTMLVEYTTNSETDIRNGSARWVPWPFGTVSTATRDVVYFPLFVRITAIAVAGVFDISGSGTKNLPTQKVVWQSDILSGQDLNSAKLFQLFGDDEMILGTYANRPLATTVAAGKEFMATDLGNMRWVSDGTQWILLAPCRIVGDATQQSIVDSVEQGTTESTLYTLNLPANPIGEDDGLQLDIIWSCTNNAATKRIRGRFGGTVLFNQDLTTHLTYRQSYKLRNRNSRAAQVAQANSTTSFGPIGSVDVQTFTIDFSVAQVLTLTGQFVAAGTGTNDLTLEEVSIYAI